MTRVSESFKRRLNIMIRHFGRWNSARDIKDLMIASIIEKAAEQAMTKLMNHVDNKDNIHDYEVEVSQLLYLSSKKFVCLFRHVIRYEYCSLIVAPSSNFMQREETVRS